MLNIDFLIQNKHHYTKICTQNLIYEFNHVTIMVLYIVHAVTNKQQQQSVRKESDSHTNYIVYTTSDHTGRYWLYFYLLQCFIKGVVRLSDDVEESSSSSDLFAPSPASSGQCTTLDLQLGMFELLTGSFNSCGPSITE